MTQQEHQPTIFELFVKSRPFGKRDMFRRCLLRKMEPPITDQTYRDWEQGKREPADNRRDIINEVAIEVYGELIY